MDHGKEYIEIRFIPCPGLSLNPNLSLPSVTMQAINSNSKVSSLALAWKQDQILHLEKCPNKFGFLCSIEVSSSNSSVLVGLDMVAGLIF